MYASQTAPSLSPSQEDILEDEDLVEAVDSIKTMEAISDVQPTTKISWSQLQVDSVVT